MVRILIIIAVMITIGILLYLYFPREVIDYFSDSISPIKQQKRKFAQNTTQPPATTGIQSQPDSAKPSSSIPIPQPQFSPGKPISEYLKIQHMADENQVRILRFDEPTIGEATMRLQARDKNDIFNLLDAIERGINLRDIENVSKGYKIMYDNDGRQIVEAVIWIKYIPRFE
ncbi:MAG: hypothetical protein QME64_09335 [bacterium]|nr:hypothetical protein [bacterium]